MNRFLLLALMAFITTVSSGQTAISSEHISDINNMQRINFESYSLKTLLKSKRTTKRLIDYVIYDSGSPIEKISKRLYYRTDATDREGGYYVYDWDDEQQDYNPVPSRKVEDNYSEFDKPTTRIDYYLDEDQNKFMPSYQYSHIYNTQQQLSEYKEYEYKAEGSKWEPVLAEEYTYLADGKKHIEIKYEWDGDSQQKIGQSHREFGYDENGYFNSAICKRWNIDTQAWYLSHKFVYTNNDKGHPKKENIYKWNAESGSWESLIDNTFKHEYEYDANGNLILRKQSKKNEDGSWFVYSKNEALFDNKGRQTMKALYQYIDYNNKLEGMERLEYEYDEFGDLKVNKRYYWNDREDQWSAPHRYTYFYKDTPTQTFLMQTQDYIVFPNPVNDVLHIALKDFDSTVSLKIYNVHGELIINKVHLANKKVNLSQLNPGLYLYHIQAKDKLYQGKIQKL
jgi:hypothetical protein